MWETKIGATEFLKDRENLMTECNRDSGNI